MDSSKSVKPIRENLKYPALRLCLKGGNRQKCHAELVSASLPAAGRDLGKGWFICVLPPRENMLDIEIRAGERNLK
jgi:hypothetical protein